MIDMFSARTVVKTSNLKKKDASFTFLLINDGIDRFTLKSRDRLVSGQSKIRNLFTKMKKSSAGSSFSSTVPLQIKRKKLPTYR